MVSDARRAPGHSLLKTAIASAITYIFRFIPLERWGSMGTRR